MVHIVSVKQQNILVSLGCWLLESPLVILAWPLLVKRPESQPLSIL